MSEWQHWIEVPSTGSRDTHTLQQYCKQYAGKAVHLDFEEQDGTLYGCCTTHPECPWAVKAQVVPGTNAYRIFWNQQEHSRVPQRVRFSVDSDAGLIERKPWNYEYSTIPGSVEMESLATVDDLPDLTDRIRSYGLYDKYKAFRDGYLKWRSGSPNGAEGEPTAEGLEQSPDYLNRYSYRVWYPNLSTWLWRRTAAYWIAVTFVEGAFLFTLTCGAMAFPDTWGEFNASLGLACYVGGLFFVIGCYLMCFQVMNLQRSEEDHLRLNPFAYTEIKNHLHSLDIHMTSYWVALAYFVGAASHFIPNTMKLFFTFTHGSPAQILICMIPDLLGSFLFLVGGVLECQETKLLAHWKAGIFTDIANWTSIVNTIAGVLFLVASILECLHHYPFWVSMLFSIGSFLYLIGGINCLLLWKEDQFGLTYISQLNNVSREGKDRMHRLSLAQGALVSPDAATALTGQKNSIVSTSSNASREEDKITFSYYGVVMLVIYSLFGGLAVVSFFMLLKREVSVLDKIQQSSGQALIFILVHIVICLKGAIVVTPKEQPFRFLVLSMHVIAIGVGIHSSFTFLHVYYDVYG